MTKTLPKIANLGDACCGCGACAAKCPKKCIVMNSDEEGFLRPSIDLSACVGCDSCDSVCPVEASRSADGIESLIWAKTKNHADRASSSSGGIFALLAHSVLSRGGAVVGAAWAPDYKSVQHVIVDDESQLDSLMRSKYVQSAMRPEIYEGIRHALLSDRCVLFTGTACQIAGIRAYLGRLSDSDHLILVDVVCHGVPSPLLWERWSDFKQLTAGNHLSDVNMRDKKTGWMTYSSSYTYFDDGESSGISTPILPFVESVPFTEDWYMKAFLANACLRPSCYSCPVKRSCGSDITLGDFWGIQSVHPEVDFDGGVSAVICNTVLGSRIIESLKSGMDWGQSCIEKVLPGNPSLTTSVTPYKKRYEFMNDLSNFVDISEMMEKYDFRPSISYRLLSRLKAFKGKISRFF